jgi:phosphinothricin acetyltransferase
MATMSEETITVRPAERADAMAVATIYAPIVRETAISFESEPPTPDTMAGRIETTLQRYPWLVATRCDDVIGYAYGSEHQSRAAYRWSVNVSVYVAANAHGQGVGRELYTALIGILRAQGFRSAFAGIALPNAASVALHEAVGFEPLGVYRDVGFKFGVWHDVGYWRLGLSAKSGAPAEPTIFSAFREAATFKSLMG